MRGAATLAPPTTQQRHRAVPRRHYAAAADGTLPDPIRSRDVVRFEDADTGEQLFGTRVKGARSKALPVGRAPGSPNLVHVGEERRIRRLLPPLEPPAVFCIGLNYHKHAEETGLEVPKYPGECRLSVCTRRTLHGTAPLFSDARTRARRDAWSTTDALSPRRSHGPTHCASTCSGLPQANVVPRRR